MSRKDDAVKIIENEKIELIYAQNGEGIEKIVTESFLIYLKTRKEQEECGFKSLENQPIEEQQRDENTKSE